MADTNLQHIVINDFTPGIVEDYFGQSGAGAGAAVVDGKGFATKTNTYACVADPNSKGLVPLPGVSTTKTLTPPGTLLEGWYATNRLAAYTNDALLMATAFDGWIVVYAWEIEYDAASGGSSSAQSKYAYVTAYDAQSTDSRDTMFTRSASQYNQYRMASLTLDRLRSVDNSALPYPVANYYEVITGNLWWNDVQGSGSGWVASGVAMTANERALTDFDNIRTTFGPKGGVRSVAWIYPDPATPTTETVKQIPSSGSDDANFMLGHQGRAVFLEMAASKMGFARTYAFMRNDIVSYSQVGKLHGTGTSTIFVEENSSGYGTGASLNANELFLVKHVGGAVAVRGDLDNPTVTRLPFIESTGSVSCKGAMTPFGFVYGTQNGIYAYAGGDSAQKLSPQLDGFFWKHENAPTYEQYGLANRGRMAWWDPFVLVPNDYLMDSRTKGWWRLANNTIANNCYDVNPVNNQLYAFPYKRTIADGSNAVLYRTFDRASLASTYSWQSQPMIETTERLVTAREVTIVAQKAIAASSIDVTITGKSELGATVAARTVTFDLTSATLGAPVKLTKSIRDVTGGNFSAKYMQVRVVATGTSGAAPKIYSISLDVRDGSRGNRDGV